MERKIPQVCLVLAIILASTFLPAASNAAPREAARVTITAGTDWLGSAVAWLGSVLERIDRDRQRRERNGVSMTAKAEGEDEATGICIDPLGRPRPCPDE
jgi:hypothetical protein